MKQIIIILIIGFTPLIGKGQLKYSGQWAFHGAVGVSMPIGLSGYIGMEKYFKTSTSSVALGFDFLHQNKFIVVDKFPIRTFGLSGHYFYSLERVIRPPFFINFGIGAFGGIENFSSKNVPYGIVQNPGNQFFYGFSFKPQFEILISKTMSLYLQPEAKYFQNTLFNDFVFAPAIGVKIYL